MDRIIGGVLGLAAFAVVLVMGITKGMALGPSIVRAVVALVLGYWVGRMIFGLPGLSIVREAAGQVPPPPPAPGDSKPEGSSGGTPPSKAS